MKKDNLKDSVVSSILLFFLLILANCTIYCCEPIRSILIFNFNISDDSVSWAAYAHLLSSAICSLLAPLVLKRVTLRTAVLTSSLCLTLGTSSLFLIPLDFDVVLVGCCFSGLGLSLCLCSVLKFVVTWFDLRQRPKCLTCLGLAPFLGLALGPLLPLIFSQNDDASPGGSSSLF